MPRRGISYLGATLGIKNCRHVAAYLVIASRCLAAMLCANCCHNVVAYLIMISRRRITTSRYLVVTL